MGMICGIYKKPDNELQNFLDDDDAANDALNDDSHYMDIDKAWHGIHFMLTGTDWEGEEPGNFVCAGGEPVGDEDYGARIFTSMEVHRINAFLKGLSNEEFRKSYDPERMALMDIYPAIWDEGDEALEYLSEYFEQLKVFVAEASKENLGLLISIN